MSFCNNDFGVNVFLFLVGITDTVIGQCRYEQLNRRALDDLELYDKTGRVRTPSIASSSDSEGDTKKVSKEPGESSRRATHPDLNTQPVVACRDEKGGEGSSTPKPEHPDKPLSVSSEEGGIDSDFDAPDSEYVLDTSSESTALEDNNTEVEDDSKDEQDDRLENDCSIREEVHLYPNYKSQGVTLNFCIS